MFERHTGSTPAPPARPGRVIEIDTFCESCGYNLRGQTARACPECGRPFAAAMAGLGRIPWERQVATGGWFASLRAYWSTVELATFRPGFLADEIDRPVSQSAARRFRLVTLALALPTRLAQSSATPPPKEKPPTTTRSQTALKRA